MCTEKEPVAAHRSVRTTAGGEGPLHLSPVAHCVSGLSWFLFLHLVLGSCSFILIATVNMLFTIICSRLKGLEQNGPSSLSLGRAQTMPCGVREGFLEEVMYE